MPGSTSPDGWPYALPTDAVVDYPDLSVALADKIQSDLFRKNGGTLTGQVTLPSAPTADLHAATKKYVDDKVVNNVTGGSTTVAPSQSAVKNYVDGRIWSGTQAEYDAIGTKDPAVLYCITA
jgi:predicted RecA/RadA family phage recombinase